MFNKVVKYNLLFLLLFSLCYCNNNRSKKKIKAVITLCNQQLFVEKYEISGGGAYDGDIISAYLTDSTNFRLYLRTYDNAHEGLRFQCSGENIITVYYLVADTTSNEFEVRDTTVYNLTLLRKKKIFE